MAVIDLILDKRPTLGVIRLDASLSEVHEEAGEITRNPVEFGSDKADHYRNLPPRLQIEGVVSNTIPTLRQIAEVSPVRAAKAEQAMLALKTSGIPFIVTTSKRVYTQMLFESLSSIHDLENSEAYRFTAVLSRVEFFTTTIVDALADSVTDLAGGAAAASAGATSIASPSVAASALEVAV